MLSSNVLITLLPILALTGTTTARISGGHHNPRTNHAAIAKKTLDNTVEPVARALDHPIGLEQLRRDASQHLAERADLDAKKKRKVKKRKAGCIAQTAYTGNGTASATVTDSATGVDVPYQTPTVTATESASASLSSSDSASVSASASSSSISNGVFLATGSATSSATASATSTGWNWWGTSSSSASSASASVSASASATSSASSSAASASASSTSDWQLVEAWSGSSFFDNFNFWSWSDPTHGTVQYVDAATAWNEGLVYINSAGNPVMKVDTTEQVSNARKSVRIHGNLVYTGGLVLMDALHMPTGCGTWPAWWSNGPNWPQGGEIDILEGVNAFTQNQVSLHTGTGCNMPNGGMSMSGQLTTGSYNSYDCSSYDTSNQGCGVRDEANDNSYGTGFNNVGGGVYAMKWDTTGINVWWFPRSSIPSDISSGSPEPSGWGTPVANFPSTDCSPFEYFYEHFNIFDTTLCGDWAGADGVWNYAGYAGQDQSCAAQTGYSSCSDYVLNKGSAFADAYWEISYVKYYNSTTWV